jgi:hypothetical protein
MTTPSDGTADTEPTDAREAQSHFRRTLWRVMAMQVGALIVLGLLQFRYTW